MKKVTLVSGFVAGVLLLAAGNMAFAQANAGHAAASHEQAASKPAADGKSDGTKDAQEQGEDAEQREFNKALQALNWVKGPSSVELFNNSDLKLAQGYVFLRPADAAKLQQMEQNLSDGNEYFLAPADLHWQAFFRYDNDGYVKDDEKIDAKAILKSISEGTEEGNAERRQRGWPEMEVVGWQTPPYYDPQTHRLEWAITGREKGSTEQVVNFNTRILGRGGVTSVVLVADLEGLPTAIAELKTALQAFDYHDGQKYAQYKAGDKVAKYGLAALVTGGVAAVAVKTGLWKVILGALAAGWKVIAAGVVALFGGLAKMFKGKDKNI